MRTVARTKELYHPTAEEITLDRLLAALSDPIRRDILARIAADGPQSCGQLDYNLAKSTMSHHFRVLRESGLIHTEVLSNRRRLWRRDSTIEGLFPGLLDSVGLPSAGGQWQENELPAKQSAN